MSFFDDVRLPDLDSNPDPRCPCILLLDTSSSMEGTSINALNEGLRAFQSDIQSDDLAKRRVELAIVTFGYGGVQMPLNFVVAGQLQCPLLTTGGDTPMGKAIHLSLDMVNSRKEAYKAHDITYYRPWIFMITDGEPTDEWQSAAQRVRVEEAAKAMSFFAVGVAGANMQNLAQISVRKPLSLQGLKFNEMFLWLSASQKRVSASKVGDMTALPPVDGWGFV